MTSIDTTRFTPAPRGARTSSSTIAGFAAVFVTALVSACSSSSGTNGENVDSGASAQTTCPVTPAAQPAATTCSPAGGASVGGSPDTHCVANGTRTVQATGVCETTTDAAAGDDDSGDDAGYVDDGRCGNTDYQPTIYGTSGSDDDCKYDVSWTSTPICQGGPVYFTVTAKKRSATSDADDTPLTGASVRIESYLNDCMHLPPNSQQMSTEGPAGVYKVGPVLFDKTGRWNVRFHFNECCVDIPEDSPHGHAAYWVDVP